MLDKLQKIKRYVKDNNIRISCIVPAYNEASRISKVLNVLVTYPLFDEIIVVNDGSTDATASVVGEYQKLYKQIIFIDRKDNFGKTKTVIEGVQKATGDIVILIDADLKNLQPKHLNDLLYPIFFENYDMTILDRISDRLNWTPVGILGIGRLFGGERCFWRADFMEIDFSKYSQASYNLETIMNIWFLKHDKRVRTVFASDLVSALQFEKWGGIKGLKRYLEMFWNMYKVMGIRNFYIQCSEIEDDHLKELYFWYTKLKEKRAHFKHLVRPLIFLGVIGVGVSVFGLYSLKKLKLPIRKGRKR